MPQPCSMGSSGNLGTRTGMKSWWRGRTEERMKESCRHAGSEHGYVMEYFVGTAAESSFGEPESQRMRMRNVLI